MFVSKTNKPRDMIFSISCTVDSESMLHLKSFLSLDNQQISLWYRRTLQFRWAGSLPLKLCSGGLMRENAGVNEVGHSWRHRHAHTPLSNNKSCSAVDLLQTRHHTKPLITGDRHKLKASLLSFVERMWAKGGGAPQNNEDWIKKVNNVQYCGFMWLKTADFSGKSSHGW